MSWTLAEVAKAIGGRIIRGDPATLIPAVSTDSRDEVPGALFFAIRGPNFDGHQFVAAACANGACGAVISGGEPAEAPVLIFVADTHRALGDLAAHTRRRRPLQVFAVGGSNGKTTTKEMLAAASAERWPGRVLKSPGNHNNLIGLPLALLALAEESAAVLELGTNQPGEMRRLTEIAAPDYAVLTNIGVEHLEGLGTLSDVASEEGDLFAGLSPSAVAAVNADDPLVVEQSRRFSGRTVRFGAGAEVHAEHVVDLGLDGIAFSLRCDGAEAPVRLRLPGRHMVANALAAAALAWASGNAVDVIAAGLERVRPVPMRMEIRRLRNQVTLINDSYNANPGSMEAALRALVSLPGRSLAVLGEMRELGTGSVDVHRQLGERAASLGVDLLVVLGGVAEVVASGAHAAGMRADSIIVSPAHADAAAAVVERWQRGDVVLVKGSRGAAMEKVVALLEEAGNRP